MSSQDWNDVEPSPRLNMRPESIHDAMNPAPNPSVLRNSTFKLSNIQKSSSRDSAESSKSSISRPSNYQKPHHRTTSVPVSMMEENEVDYYHNPTELFRWINYRRWDGARARVNSNPEECSIWVVSRHSTDGRILWRQLPLHLVCMQSGVKQNFVNDENRDSSESSARSVEDENANLKQIEHLIEELIEAFPEAVSQQDDQGMLPLHSCLNAINPSTGPNERILSLLLLADATAIQVRDSYGRTPIDIVNEKVQSVPAAESALRLLVRAQAMGKGIKDAMSNETRAALSKVEQHAENERLASQRILRRMEQELADEQNKAQREMEAAAKVRETSQMYREELRMIKKDYATLELDLDQARKERDDLVAKNEILRNEMDKQESEVAEINREAEKKIEEQAQVVASLRSEASTARAMAEGMESQLRSKFTNEENLRNSVSQARKEIATIAAQSKREKKKLQDDIERLEDELKHSQSVTEELEKTNEALEERNKVLDKHLGQVLVAYNSLSSEYDQLFDSTSRHESSIMESIRVERNNIAVSIEKQKKMFEASIAEQQRLMEEATKKESMLSEMFTNAKKRELEAVGKIKDSFKEVRTQLSANHCMIFEAATRQEESFAKPIEESTIKDSSNTSTQSAKVTMKHAPLHGVQELSQNRTKTKAFSTEVKAASNQKARGNECYESPGLLSFLEERAQHSTRRQPSPRVFPPILPSASSSSEQRRSTPPLPESGPTYAMPPLKNSSSSRKEHVQSTMQYSSKKVGIPSPVITVTQGRRFSETPGNSREVMRPRVSQIYDGGDSTTDAYTVSQNSFSLDEFSDMESRISCNLSTFGEQRNQYKGMRHAVKQDLIRVETEGIGDPTGLRDSYSS